MACDSRSITVGGGSEEATDDGSVSIVPVTGATMVGTETRNSGGVGCPISSLKVASRLLNTGVSVTSIEEI